jgi:RNA-directed DNA polymerase
VGSFDTISHSWLERHIPMDRNILHKWLKAGYLERHAFHPTIAGTPQGGLCKALHSPPYAKWKAMQSTGKTSVKFLGFCPMYFA